MRRGALIAAAVLAVYAAPARAATTEVRVANFAFSPSTVTIAPGDTVTWRFSGPDTNHSATSDGGQAEAWDSDPGNPNPNHLIGDTFSHTFSAAGTFGYFCKAHLGMRGRVVVSAPGAQPPPAADTTAPRLTTLRANAQRRRVTFKLDEAATVAVKLRGPTRRDSTLTGRAGTNVVKLPKRMRRGRHTVTLTATDAAGNKAPAAKIVVSVKR